ncbi:conserved repeat domain-containing protein [Pseudobutyrivibrio sp. YE44]|uniref:hypothetical protein n=1 Tax=Pseudobutyrivibrio sp. YE44 TaxID=1520802 RepID=UPI0008846CFE|nr:hypothetical protein [Pseudobutyrivibrio sp. YE44]SDB34769.1 conserved repeat domain-containing protein [Pseudobutyrivibrio sp. YE44]
MKKFYLNMVFALTLTVATIFGNSIVSIAATESLEWTVDYLGGKNFETKGKDATKSKIESAMPGDTIKYVVTYKNSSDVTSDFYLCADVLSSLENNALEGSEASAKGGAYTYSVKYGATGTETTIYDSDIVGGDSVVSQGLNQVDNDKAYVYVGRLSKGQDSKVVIEINLDGNTQDNSYMRKLAELSVQFAVQDVPKDDSTHEVIEKVNTENKKVVYEIPGGQTIVKLDESAVPQQGGNPRTGDSILPIVFCGITLAFGLMLILWYFKLTRENKEEVA